MKILVTDCAGFIENHLVDRLTHLRHEVIGINSFIMEAEGGLLKKCNQINI